MKDRDESESNLFTRVLVKAYYLRQDDEHLFAFTKAIRIVIDTSKRIMSAKEIAAS